MTQQECINNQKHNIMTQQECYQKAKHFFNRFSNEEITFDNLIAHLVDITNYNDSLMPDQKEFFINEYILEQAKMYRNNPTKNAYLFSLISSGSLLTQFEPYDPLDF